MPKIVVHALSDLDDLAKAITRSASDTARGLAELATMSSGLSLLRALRFEPQGRQPLGDRPLNLIEQLNQTFTYLATFAGVRYLFREHPGSEPYTLNLGTTRGPDIISRDGSIAAEVFAAVDPENNDKLAKDISVVISRGAVHSYIFYYSPGHDEKAKLLPHPTNVTVVSLGLTAIEG